MKVRKSVESFKKIWEKSVELSKAILRTICASKHVCHQSTMGEIVKHSDTS